jgi:hypothetical protein
MPGNQQMSRGYFHSRYLRINYSKTNGYLLHICYREIKIKPFRIVDESVGFCCFDHEITVSSNVYEITPVNCGSESIRALQHSMLPSVLRDFAGLLHNQHHHFKLQQTIRVSVGNRFDQLLCISKPRDSNAMGQLRRVLQHICVNPDGLI